MVNKDKLINSNEVIYQDMFGINSNGKYETRSTRDNSIELDKLINTNEVFYQGMIKPKSKH